MTAARPHIHYPVTIKTGQMVELRLDAAANVLVMNDAQYDGWKQGQESKVRGGYATKSPVNLRPPYSGSWHIVVDTKGADIRSACAVVQDVEESN